MRGESGEEFGCELRLIFADGYSMPFALRELVAIVRHQKVIALTCVFAVLLALPGGGAFSAEVPLLARILLNLFSVGLFAILFPALLQEAHVWACDRRLRFVPEPVITIPTALITTLAVEALAIFIVGQTDLTRWDLALKLGFGAVFWELHITMMLRFVGPAMRAHSTVSEQARGQVEVVPTELRIGNAVFEPTSLRRIETDDHFLIIHHANGCARVLASLNDVEGALAPFGLRVHRRHWVASHDLGCLRLNGRSYLMRTRSGEDIPVARERKKTVAAAVKAVIPE